MRFVPAGTPGVLFSVWETWQRDWPVFAKEEPARAAGRRENTEFFSDDHAMSLANWIQAKAFCEWLTAKERAAGRIGTKPYYRLPTDHEWSVAVGIGDREDPRLSPKAKDGKVAGVYPWGTEWPPPFHLREDIRRVRRHASR